jgi:hypothetical protein
MNYFLAFPEWKNFKAASARRHGAVMVMGKLESILEKQREAAAKITAANDEFQQFRDAIAKGEDSTRDLVKDFLIVDRGYFAENDYEAVQKTLENLSQADEVLIKTVIDGYIEHHTCHMTHGTTQRESHRIEAMRFATVKNPLITLQGIVIPGDYVWTQREGLMRYERDLFAGFSPWEIEHSDLTIDISSPSKQQLRFTHGREEENFLPQAFKKGTYLKSWDFSVLSATTSIYTGTELEKATEELNWHYQGKKNTFLTDARKVLDLGMNLKAYEEKLAKEREERKRVLGERLFDKPTKQDIVDAIGLGMHEVKGKIVLSPSLTGSIPDRIMELAEEYGIKY